MIAIKLQDGQGTSNVAKVNSDGVLAVGPLKSSIPISQELDVINTPFNFFRAKEEEKFVVTDIIINADNFVSINGADVTIYEANSVTSLTILKTIIQIDIGRSQTVPITGLQLDVSAGVFINAQTDSTNVNLTIAGYFVPLPGSDKI